MMRWLAVLLAVSALLAGCVSVPSDGPVQRGLQGPVPDAADALVRPIANPPQPGMDPVEVVAGFLDAAAAVGDDYRVARQYLTPDAATAWNPGAGVVVMADDGPDLSLAESVVTARFQQLAAVSASGVVQREERAASSVALPMAAVNGEWRIADPPDGLLLTDRQLDRAFHVRNAYFLTAAGSIAVPDVRLLPITGAEALATALVSALLAGPSQHLAPGVTSAIPMQTQLALGAVPVADGVARVDLQGPALPAEPQLLERFGAQFAWTLRQVPDVEAMEIALNGSALPLADQRGAVRLVEYERYNPDVIVGEAPLYGVTDEGVLAEVVDGGVRPLGAEGTANRPPVTAIAVSPSGLLVAGRLADASGVLLGYPELAERPLRTVAGRVASGPRIDATGRVWWTTPDGAVVLADGTGEDPSVVDVAVAGLPGPVRAVRPARDGARVALLVGDGAERTLHIGVVALDGQRPVITGLRELPAAARASDVAWRQADELTALIGEQGIIRRIDLQGSPLASFSVPATTRTLTDAPNAAVVLGLADGSAGTLTGNGVRIVEGLSAPAYPG